MAVRRQVDHYRVSRVHEEHLTLDFMADGSETDEEIKNERQLDLSANTLAGN